MVDSLSDEFRMLSSRYLNSVYEPEPIGSGSESDCSTASDESNHHRSKYKPPAVPDAKKRGGLMKLAQAFSGSSGNRPKSSSSSAAAASKVKLKTEDVWDTPSPDSSSETELKSRKTNIKSKVLFFLFSLFFNNKLNAIDFRRKLRKRKGKSRNLLLDLGI